MWELAHQKPGQQKTADPNQEAAVKRGEIFVQRIFPRCTSKGTRPSATVGFLRPRLAALVNQCVPDVSRKPNRTPGAAQRDFVS
jgi:hypothetical protein